MLVQRYITHHINMQLFTGHQLQTLLVEPLHHRRMQHTGPKILRELEISFPRHT